MESYVVLPYEIIETNSTDKPETGFCLVYLQRDEWERIADILRPEHGEIDMDYFREIAIGEQRQICNGELTALPRIAHFEPEVHFICLRDIDEEGREIAVEFLITANCFIFLRYPENSKTITRRWAHRGVLVVPLDLVNLLALDIMFHHQIWLDKVESSLLQLERDILLGPQPSQQERIVSFHQKVTLIKKSVSLHQTVFARLGDLEDKEDDGEKDLYQELKESSERFMDMLQNTQGMIENLRDAYQTGVQNLTNDITKLLTLLATLFLPISLLTGFFGMNFENLPLVKTTYGIWLYYASSALIVVITFSYFKHQGWFRFWHRRH